MKVCENCQKEHDGSYGSGRFCSTKCARGFSTKSKRKEINEKVSKAFKSKPKKKKYCVHCGAEKNKCKSSKICKRYRLFPGLIKYFGFNKNVLGTEDLYEEYHKIRNLLIEDYYDNKMTLTEIMLKYNYDNHIRNFYKFFQALEINRRSLSDSIFLAYKNNNKFKNLNNFKSKYKNGWHITWNNKRVFYRSSYELKFAKKLDKQKINYEMESLRILYWDSQMLKQRIAIPDFYLPDENKIIEIKSNYTYDEQNMKDKEKEYLKHGYKFELIFGPF